MHCRVSLNLVLTHSLNFFIITKRVSDWHHFCEWNFLYSILQVAVSVGTMQLPLSIAIMQLPTSVAIMQFLRFYCNYVGGTFCYIYFDRSFCCNYAGDCFCWNYFCTIYGGESVCSKYVGDNLYWNYGCGSLCYNHVGGIFYSVSCRWLVYVIMQVTGCSYVCDSFK